MCRRAGHREKRMNRVLDVYCRALSAICALLMAAMVVLVFGNVVLRYAFSTGWLISEEISRWMFVWMVFIGSIVALRENAHLGTDMVVVRLPAGVRRACTMVAQLIMLYISWLMLSGSWSQVEINAGTEAPVSGLPLSFLYFCGVVFAVSTLLILFYELWMNLSGRRDSSALMVQECADLEPPRSAASRD